MYGRPPVALIYVRPLAGVWSPSPPPLPNPRYSATEQMSVVEKNKYLHGVGGWVVGGPAPGGGEFVMKTGTAR